MANCYTCTNILVQPELSICDTDQDNQCFVDENDPYFVGDKLLWQLCRQQTPCPPPLWFPVECMRPFWGGGVHNVPIEFWISKPFISSIEKEALSLSVFYNKLLLYFPLLLSVSQSQPILMSFVYISSVLQCYFKAMSPHIFSPTGPHLCNIAHFLNL